MALIGLNFKIWLDELERAANHEAGHAIAMKKLAPNWFVSVFLVRDPTRPDGWGGGTIYDSKQPTPAVEILYFIALAGCLAEAKGAAGGHIDREKVSSAAGQIVQGLRQAEPAFPVDIPIVGRAERERASCSKNDFELIAVPLDDNDLRKLLRQFLVQVCDFVEDQTAWERVVATAALLSAAPHWLVQLP